MPRYFFHIRDGQDFPDAEGTELPDRSAVRGEALQAAGEILKGTKGTGEFWAGDDWIMSVQDEHGGSVLTLRFSGTEHD